MFMVRLVLELLGLAGAPALTRRMRDRGKLAVGAGAAGAVVFTAGTLPGGLISLLFDDHAYAVQGVTTALDVVSQAGGLLMLCSLITLFLWRRNALLRWTDAAGWGSVRCGWVNRLALAMVAGGIIGLIPFMPFHDVANVFASAGVVVLVLGIVPQMMAG